MQDAAFTAPHAAPPAQRMIEQGLHRGDGGRWYVYAGATGPESRLRDDPRWTPRNDEAESANRLVNTKIGVGWEKGGVQSSFGYLRRRLTDAPMVYGAAPRRDSMIGLSLSMRR